MISKTETCGGFSIISCMGTVILGIIGYKVITMMIKETMHCSDLGKCVFPRGCTCLLESTAGCKLPYALIYPTHVPDRIFRDIHTLDALNFVQAWRL